MPAVSVAVVGEIIVEGGGEGGAHAAAAAVDVVLGAGQENDDMDIAQGRPDTPRVTSAPTVPATSGDKGKRPAAAPPPSTSVPKRARTAKVMFDNSAL